MIMKRRIEIVLILLLAALLLGGCSALPSARAESETPAETEEPSPEPTPEPTPTPEPLRDANGDLRFPDGSVYHGYEVKISLPKLEGKDVERTIELLGEMPNVHTVDLGARKAGRLLALSSIEKLQAACPDVNFIFRFSLWGKEVSTADKELDLKYIPMDDEGAAVIRALRVMPKCTYLDMDTCGVSSEAMGKIREQFPDVEVVWRIWFGKEFSVRTDCERIIATNHLNDANSKDLKYCTKVRLLDVGHNPNLTDISFLTDMTELECCILAIMPFRDLTPLTNCTKMEYLELCEMQTHPGQMLDLSPLAGMTHLHHLNICKLYEVENYEWLENCTELERLWIGVYTYIPKEYIEHLKEVLPDTKINWWTQVAVTEKWREDPAGIFVERYALLREQFDYKHCQKSTSYWWNDPLCLGNQPVEGA